MLKHAGTIAHATKVPGLIFLSGQTPLNKNGRLVEGGIKEHTVSVIFLPGTTFPDQLISAKAQCIENLGNVLSAAGSSWEKVVKVNVYLKDMDNFGAMNEVYEKVRMSLMCWMIHCLVRSP